MATIAEALWAKEGMEVTVMVNHPFVNCDILPESKLMDIELICASSPEDKYRLYKTCIADLVSKVVTFPEECSEDSHTVVRCYDGRDYIVKIKTVENYIKGENL